MPRSASTGLGTAPGLSFSIRAPGQPSTIHSIQTLTRSLYLINNALPHDPYRGFDREASSPTTRTPAPFLPRVDTQHREERNGQNTRRFAPAHWLVWVLAFLLSAFCLTSAMADERTIKDEITKALLPANRSKFVDFAEKLGMGESAKFMRDQLLYMEASASERPRLAKEIYDKYIKAGSNREININNDTRSAIDKGMDKPMPSLFSGAYKEMLNLMAANLNQSHRAKWEDWVKANLK